MEGVSDPHGLARYLAQVAGGLIPFGVLAVTIHAYVAAEALVAAIIVLATLTAELALRDGEL